jgi:transposase
MVKWTELSSKEFRTSCQTIKIWVDEILAYFDGGTTQRIIEGINQKIKLIKSRDRGKTYFYNLRIRIMLN